MIIWAVTWENVPSDMCAQRRLKSACASVQSDQNRRCPHEETLHPWLYKLRPVKILIRLCECAVWSESSLGAHVERYVFWRISSYCVWKLAKQGITQELKSCINISIRVWKLGPVWRVQNGNPLFYYYVCDSKNILMHMKSLRFSFLLCFFFFFFFFFIQHFEMFRVQKVCKSISVRLSSLFLYSVLLLYNFNLAKEAITWL